MSKYNGEIVAGSLLVKESRIIADLLLRGLEEKKFYQEVLVSNVLQKRSPASAKRQAKLIRNRLLPLHKDFWIMIRDGSYEQSGQTLFAASIAHSHLLGDFIMQTVQLSIKTFQKQISYRDWDSFFEECKHRDPVTSIWAESTTKKIRQVIFRILAEAQVIDSTKNMNLIPFSLLPGVKELLIRHEENYVLKCLEAIQ
ncbi:DUF1819 family protein [Maridesulfovibrio sp.]|uniref:DUF1819 family protein n=1 Tax=Maridesulfovibrio sp. TaxID=2795000 RepID=UPI003B00686A